MGPLASYAFKHSDTYLGILHFKFVFMLYIAVTELNTQVKSYFISDNISPPSPQNKKQEI